MKPNLKPILIACALLPFIANADHPTISLEKGSPGPITTGTAVPLPKGTLTTTAQSQFLFNDELSDSTLRRASILDEDVHSVKSLTSLSARGAYGVTDDFTIGLALPYIWRNSIREAGHHDQEEGETGHHEEEEEHGDESEEGTVENLGDSTGLGDLALFGQIRFLNSSGGDQQASLLLGLKTPTGRTDARSTEGELFETELQPGSGSWDPMVGLAFSQHSGSFSYDASVLYIFATEGSQDTNLGNIFNYNAAVSYRLIGATSPEEPPHDHGGKEIVASHAHDSIYRHGTTWDLILEANGDWREKVNKSGLDDGNTGGNLIYLSAGTRVGWGNGWAATVSAGIPIVKDLNGIQSEPNARVLVGLSKAF